MTPVVFLFLDGVGLGADDALVNPLATVQMPVLTGLLGGARLLADTGAVQTQQASLTVVDARLGVPGRPQSATGQTALLTGRNASALLGEHFGPRPNAALRELLEGDTLFRRAAQGGAVCYVNAFPAGYFSAVARGKRLHGAIPHAAAAAGLRLRTAEDLAAGRALSADFTNAGWREGLGYADMPVWTAAEAGAVLAELAQGHRLTFFEHWPTDMLGHRGDLAGAVQLFEEFDRFLGGLLAGLDLQSATVVITSDHGNVEDCSQRSHTLNPVPAVVIGAGHAELASQLRSLTDFMPVLAALWP